MRERVRQLWKHLREEHVSPGRLGVAVGLGLAIGITPFFGLHWAIGLAAAWAFGLNKLTILLASNISIPPIAPFIVTACVATGDLLRYGEVRLLSDSDAQGVLESVAWLGGEVSDRFVSCLLGSVVIGVPTGLLAGILVWRWATARTQHSPLGPEQP